MDWRDEGVLLTVRRHGEGAAIIELFTAGHGRHAGVVPGGGSRRMAPLLQPGAQLALEWRARLEDHIGAYRVEPVRSRAAELMADRLALAAFSSVAALLTAFLPERESHPALYAETLALIDRMGAAPGWQADYARWELGLLAELGYGLDLGECAATGASDELVWVSPRSGRAVSASAGAPWADRLLPLPAFLRADAAPGPGEIAAALALTGRFLEAWVAPAFHRPLPAARRRLGDLVVRAGL